MLQTMLQAHHRRQISNCVSIQRCRASHLDSRVPELARRLKSSDASRFVPNSWIKVPGQCALASRAYSSTSSGPRGTNNGSDAILHPTQNSKDGSRGQSFESPMLSAIRKNSQFRVSKNSDRHEPSEDVHERLKEELRRTQVDVSKLGRHVGFDDVIGLDLAKQALREAVIWPAIADPALFRGVRANPGGLLLYGPPGCGKTMLARAAAIELVGQASMFHIRAGDIMSKYYGESQRKIQALEDVVKEAAPAIVFIDEVDSLLGARDTVGVAAHHQTTTNSLLTWMDGLGRGNERIFFLGATNRPEAIDEAALRRFGDAVEVSMPSLQARISLLRHLVLVKAQADGHRVHLSDDDIDKIGERTKHFSLADVDGLARRAFLHVIRCLPSSAIRPGLHPADVPPVTFENFEAALVERIGSTRGLAALLKMRTASAKPTRRRLRRGRDGAVKTEMDELYVE